MNRTHHFPNIYTIIIFTLFLNFYSFSCFAENSNKHLYVTWEGSGIDKGASAWLIKRFIDKNAIFNVLPVGEKIEHGFAFDVPESKFRRTHRYSTFTQLLLEYKIKDPVINEIEQIVTDIEINAWRKKVSIHSAAAEYIMDRFSKRFKKELIPLSCHINMFDLIYDELKANKDFSGHAIVQKINKDCKE